MYFYYIHKEKSKLVKLTDINGKDIVRFTHDEFNLIAELFGYDRDDFIKLGNIYE